MCNNNENGFMWNDYYKTMEEPDMYQPHTEMGLRIQCLIAEDMHRIHELAVKEAYTILDHEDLNEWEYLWAEVEECKEWLAERGFDPVSPEELGYKVFHETDEN